MSAKNILVVCYTFPPSPGIGGRRWAKFAKYLSSEGYAVHVATAKNLNNETSKWYRDVQKNEKIKIHSYKFDFQQLLTKPRNIIEKIIRKLLTYFLKITKYTEVFITSFTNRSFWISIEELIKKEKINTVIVSGDPFLFFQASQLKKKTDFQLILDYRDLWNDHSYYSKFVNLTSKQKRNFEFAENSAINNCDKIVVVDEHLKKVLSQRLKNKNSTSFYVIHNGFDSDDFKNNLSRVTTNKETTKFYFAGNIASDLNEIVIHFIKSFSELKKHDLPLYSKIEIYISGQMDKTLFDYLLQFKLENLHLSTNSISIEDYLTQLQDADAGIVILSKEYANSFITKFTDYIYLKKFVLALGYQGDFSDYLTKNKCGETFTLNNDYTFFTSLILKTKIPISLSEDVINSFNLKNLTEKYIQVINA